MTKAGSRVANRPSSSPDAVLWASGLQSRKSAFAVKGDGCGGLPAQVPQIAWLGATSPIPAAIGRRYVRLGNRSRPLGGGASPANAGESPPGVAERGADGAAAFKPGLWRHRPRRRGRALRRRARPLLGAVFQQGVQPARRRGGRAGARAAASIAWVSLTASTGAPMSRPRIPPIASRASRLGTAAIFTAG